MSEPLNQFDLLARPYRWLEYLVFQNSLEQCRFALLPALAGCRRVLTIGEGDGRFVAELVRRYPGMNVDCLEGSLAMIERARARMPQQAAVTFHHADAIGWNYPTGEYDAVVTCFFFAVTTDEKVLFHFVRKHWKRLLKFFAVLYAVVVACLRRHTAGPAGHRQVYGEIYGNM